MNLALRLLSALLTPLALYLPLAAPALAQPAGQLDPAAVTNEIRGILAEHYVLPEMRPALDEVLAEGLASGRYLVDDPAELATRINEDLARVGHDQHLNFSYHPDLAEGVAGAGAGGQDQFDEAAYEREVRSDHHGIHELRMLPGNVRYMAYDGLQWIGEDSARAIDDAARFLADGDAVIIDLRRNGGGSPAAVQRLISYFLEPGTPLVTFYMYGAVAGEPITALDDLPAPRMVGKPLYVLVSGRSASAAEELAGHVSGYGIGELVGANTLGAGFRNDSAVIGGQFLLSYSVGRAVLASTGCDWEGIGIAPTMTVPVENALEAAQAAALTRLAEAADGGDRERLLAYADALDAEASPRTPAAPLAAYAGTYGERQVLLEDGHLVYLRGKGGMPVPLVPLGGDRFALAVNPDVRLTFSSVGEAGAAMEVAGATGPAQGSYPRTGS